MIRQEIHCHRCRRWVQFQLDTRLDGNHVIRCPHCHHRHYRVVRNGRVTGVRWNRQVSQITVKATVSTLPMHGFSVPSYMSQYLNQQVGPVGQTFLMNSWLRSGL